MNVVVVGGGIVGAMAARELARAGHGVTLLEAQHLGAGSSSRTAGGIRQQFSTPDTVVAMRACVRMYREMAGETEDGASPIVQNGYLFLYSDDVAFARAGAVVETQRAAGLVEVERLDASATHGRFPWVDPGAVVGSTWCPTDGFLHPQIVYAEAARHAVAAGATVRQRSPVIGARHVGGRIVEVRTPDGTVPADVVVDATNAWAARTGPLLGGVPLDVAPLRRHLWFLRRSDAFPEQALGRMPLVIAPGGAYCRPEHGGTLMFGKKHDATPEPAFTWEDQDRVAPGHAHTDGFDAAPYAAWGELAAVMPELGGFEGVLTTTAGYYGTTPDHNPFLGFDPACPNLVRAVGFSGRGAMMAPFTAVAVRALVEAGQDLPAIDLPEGRVSLAPYRIGRPYARAEAMVI
jgi:sarcosine oxidase subunit beta